MASSAAINVLLLGATGTLGQNLLNGLTSTHYSNDFKVFALIRSDTVNSTDEKKVALIQQFKAKRVEIIEGDVSAADDVLSAIIRNHSIKVVLSAISYPHFERQINLIKAAKAAGTVDLFIPSEFGMDIEKVGKGSVISIYDQKLAVRQVLQQSGLNYLFIITGFFIEYLLSPFMGIDVANHQITAPASTDSQVTCTSLANIGLNTAALIKDKSIRNTSVYFGDATVSWKELKSIVEQVTGQKFTDRVKSAADFESACAANPSDFVARFGFLFAKQVGTHWALDKTYKKHTTPLVDTAKLILRH